MTKLALALTRLVAIAGAATTLGRPLILSQPQPLRDVLANPDSLVGKAVQVKGKVTEVCQMAGCWMALADLETAGILRVKVNDGDIVFPKEGVGRVAIAEGTLAKLTLTKEQASSVAVLHACSAIKISTSRM